jgi:hypothetical protein
MPVTQTEFDTILADASKRVVGDLYWREDDDHSPAFEFGAEVESEAGYPLYVKGWLNRLAGKLSYTVIHRAAGRIYALDLGADHHNPTCQRVGEKHKHSWTSQYADKLAYVPADVTAGPDNPVAAWRQFCTEATIRHEGALHPPPPMHEEPL